MARRRNSSSAPCQERPPDPTPAPGNRDGEVEDFALVQHPSRRQVAHHLLPAIVRGDQHETARGGEQFAEAVLAPRIRKSTLPRAAPAPRCQRSVPGESGSRRPWRLLPAGLGLGGSAVVRLPVRRIVRSSGRRPDSPIEPQRAPRPRASARSWLDPAHASGSRQVPPARITTASGRRAPLAASCSGVNDRGRQQDFERSRPEPTGGREELAPQRIAHRHDAPAPGREPPVRPARRATGAVQSGRPRARTIALATAAATRSPVKLPGPSATMMPSISPTAAPAEAQAWSTSPSMAPACRLRAGQRGGPADAPGPAHRDRRAVAGGLERRATLRPPRARAGPDREGGAGGSAGRRTGSQAAARSGHSISRASPSRSSVSQSRSAASSGVRSR